MTKTELEDHLFKFYEHTYLFKIVTRPIFRQSKEGVALLLVAAEDFQNEKFNWCTSKNTESRYSWLTFGNHLEMYCFPIYRKLRTEECTLFKLYGMCEHLFSMTNALKINSVLSLGKSKNSLELATTGCMPSFQYLNGVSPSTLQFGVYRNLYV